MVFFSYQYRFRLGLVAAVIVCVFAGMARAQKVDKGKLDAATRRASKATKVLTDLSALPASETIPKELLDRALAIAVFPDTDKVNLLFQKFMKGYGVMSRRVSGAWGAPAFYAFAVIDSGWTRVKSDNPGIIMLFMDENVLKKFEKDHIDLVGAAGPVGELTPEKENNVRVASIILYALSDGKLRGVEVEDDSTTQSGINSDNNINKAVYGLKAREVLWGNPPVATPIAPSIAEFQNALVQLSKP